MNHWKSSQLPQRPTVSRIRQATQLSLSSEEGQMVGVWFTVMKALGLVLLALVCSLAFSGRVCAQTFNQIEIVIGTGGDDLRGDSSATATLLNSGGTALKTITLKAQNQPGWGNNTSHTVTAALSPALAQSAIAHIVIRLTSHNSFPETDDNWNVESVVVMLSNGGSGAVEIVNVSGNPFVRLTGSAPTVTLTPVPVGPAGTFNEIKFVIATGGDDLRGDSSATAKLLNASGGTMQTITLKSQSQPGWGNNSTNTVTAPLSPPVKLFEIADIVITLTSHNSFPETDDNWNVQDVIVSLSNNGAGAKRILRAFGDPMVRLTGSIPSVTFPLPPLEFGPVCKGKVTGCVNVTTYHNNSLRTGWNSREKVLDAANVNAKTFGRIATLSVDDQVDAQPLIVDGVTFIATENNTLYALDFWSGASVIHHLGDPVTMPLGCGNNGPNVGINGTPVIDLRSRTLFVDVYLMDNGNPTHKIHALEIGNLQDRAHSPVTVAATQTLQGGGGFPFQAKYQRQRSGLLLADGNVYAGYGSFCDAGGSNSRGWLIGWNPTTLAALHANQLNDRQKSGGANFLSSIWMSGYGVAADAQKSLYFITGNTSSGNYNSSTNISESAVKVSADLTTVESFFTPSNVNSLDGGDTDYGSGGLMLLPDLPGAFPHVAVGAGKDGRMFVFDRGNLSGFHPTDVPENVSVGDCWCGPSFFQAGTAAQPVNQVVSSGGHTVMLWKTAVISGGSPKPTLEQVATADIDFNPDLDGGFFTSVSSNALTPKSAVIWAVGREEGADHHVTLYAFDGTPTGSSLSLLWSSPNPAGFWPNVGGNSNIVPTVANGHVFVASNKQVQIFGLTLRPQGPRGPFPIAGPASVPPETGAQFWGTVKSVSSDRIVVELRNGAELQVDLTSAVQEGRAAEARPGMLVVVSGKMNADGSLRAEALARAKGKGAWGEDRRK